MRDLLTGLAIVLIVALTAALVGPYLVDWNGQRAFLETRLSHALGQKVTIGGHIDLKLLPTPYLVLDQTVVGGDEGPVRIGIRHLNLELSITPLLHGEFDIIEARLQEPTLRVALQPGHRLPAIGSAPAFDANLRFDRIVVNDGTIIIFDGESGQNLVANHLDFTAEAPSLSGPFKGNGSAGPFDSRTKFRFTTTIAQKGQTRTHVSIDENSTHAGIDLDGLMTFAQFGATGIQPNFDGTIALSGHIHENDSDSAEWSLTGPLQIGPNDANLEGGTLRLTKDDAAVSLDANGHASFQERVNLTLALSAKQLDLDNLFSKTTSDLTQPPVSALTTLRKLIPTTQSDLDLKIASATFRSETLNDISGHLSFKSKADETFHLSMSGPSGSRIMLDGTSTGEKTAGSFALAADDASDTTKWLSSIRPDSAVSNSELPFTKIRAKGTYSATPIDVTINDLTLDLDRSEITGDTRFVYGANGTPSRLVANLKAKTLDLDSLPSLDSFSTASHSLDLQLSFDANSVKVSQIGEGNLAAGHLSFDLSRTDQQILLKDFHADDIGGATIVGSGKADATTADFSLAINARKLDGVAIAVARLAPGQLSDAFKMRAPSLAPTNLKVAASFARTNNSAFHPTSLSVNGKLASTAIDMALSPDPEHDQIFGLKAEVDAPQGHTLLHQLGLQTLPLDVLGRGHIAVDAHGSMSQPFEARLDGSFGETHFSAKGQMKISGRSPGGSGTIAIKSLDIGPLLQSLALTFPDPTQSIPLDVVGGIAIGGTGIAFSDLKGSIDGEPVEGGLKWEQGQSEQLSGSFDFQHLTLSRVFGLALGAPQPPATDIKFSNAPFTTGLIDPPRSKLKLRTKTLDLGQGFVASQASFDLRILPNVVELKNLSADFQKGRVAANLTIRRDGPQAAVEGEIVADNVDLSSSAARGQLTARLNLAGSGKSAASLVSSLAGSGDAALKDLRVDGADPTSLSHVFGAIERDEVSIDNETVARTYTAAAVNPLSAGDRQFHLGLASGTLRLDSLDTGAANQPVSTRIEGSLDLNRLQFRTATTETLETLPKNWSGSPPSITVVWSGALATPARQVDVSNLISAAAARALARETARLEAYELDIRERAFFNARLSSEHRRETDRVKAEDDAKKAEAARLAAKKAAEDKAAQEKAEREDPAKQPSDRSSGSPVAVPDDQSRRFQNAPHGNVVDPSSAGRY